MRGSGGRPAAAAASRVRQGRQEAPTSPSSSPIASCPCRCVLARGAARARREPRYDSAQFEERRLGATRRRQLGRGRAPIRLVAVEGRVDAAQRVGGVHQRAHGTVTFVPEQGLISSLKRLPRRVSAQFRRNPRDNVSMVGTSCGPFAGAQAAFIVCKSCLCQASQSSRPSRKPVETPAPRVGAFRHTTHTNFPRGEVEPAQQAPSAKGEQQWQPCQGAAPARKRSASNC